MAIVQTMTAGRNLQADGTTTVFSIDFRKDIEALTLLPVAVTNVISVTVSPVVIPVTTQVADTSVVFTFATPPAAGFLNVTVTLGI